MSLPLCMGLNFGLRKLKGYVMSIWAKINTQLYLDPQPLFYEITSLWKQKSHASKNPIKNTVLFFINFLFKIILLFWHYFCVITTDYISLPKEKVDLVKERITSEKITFCIYFKEKKKKRQGLLDTCYSL